MNICYYNEYYILSSLNLFLFYFWDCMDGNYARTYNMVTKFGD